MGTMNEQFTDTTLTGLLRGRMGFERVEVPRVAMSGHLHYADSQATPLELRFEKNAGEGKLGFSLVQGGNDVAVSMYVDVDPKALKRLVTSRAADVSRPATAQGRPRMFSNRIVPSAP
jgi:hypothetical protein